MQFNPMKVYRKMLKINKSRIFEAYLKIACWKRGVLPWNLLLEGPDRSVPVLITISRHNWEVQRDRPLVGGWGCPPSLF
jgi:hypothetical protein